MHAARTEATSADAGPSAAADTDEALLMRYGAGEVAAFERLYARHERPVYRFLLRSVGIPALADELLQEVWMSVIRAAASFEPRARFTTWLYRIARSRLIDHWRASDAAVLARLDDDPPGEPGSESLERIAGDEALRPDVMAMDRARARAFAAAVEELPAAQREALLLHLEAGLTLAQIAQITGAGAETVKSRIRYACARLERELQDWRKDATR